MTQRRSPMENYTRVVGAVLTLDGQDRHITPPTIAAMAGVGYVTAVRVLNILERAGQVVSRWELVTVVGAVSRHRVRSRVVTLTDQGRTELRAVHGC